MFVKQSELFWNLSRDFVKEDFRSYDMMAPSMRVDERVYGTGQVQEMAE